MSRTPQRWSWLCALVLALASAPAFANGDGELGTFTTMDVPGGDVTVVGAGTAGRQEGQPFVAVDLTLTLPEGHEVVRAFLYVNTLGSDGTEALQVRFAHNPVLADRIGTGPATCWGPLNLNRVYRVDVTADVTGSGEYHVAGVPSSLRREQDSQGIALLVIHGDPASEDITRVRVADGALALDNPADLQHIFEDILVPDATQTARLHVAVGDGQHDNSRLLFGETLLSENAFPGANGPLYDVRSHTITPLLPARSPDAMARITSPLDCLAWNVAVLTVTAPADTDSDGDGVPDWTDECPFIPNPCEPEPDPEPEPEPDPEPEPEPEPDVGPDMADADDAGDADHDMEVPDIEDVPDVDEDAADADQDPIVDDATDPDVAPDVPEEDLGSEGDTSDDTGAADTSAEPVGLFGDGSILGGGGCAITTGPAPREPLWLAVLVAGVALVHLRRKS